VDPAVAMRSGGGWRRDGGSGFAEAVTAAMARPHFPHLFPRPSSAGMTIGGEQEQVGADLGVNTL
jgi:hypothetical protein